MIEPWGLLIVGFFAVTFGYVWLTHVAERAVESAIAEREVRMDRIEERLDALEAAADDGDR